MVLHAHSGARFVFIYFMFIAVPASSWSHIEVLTSLRLRAQHVGALNAPARARPTRVGDIDETR
jgi:hypothetical protein